MSLIFTDFILCTHLKTMTPLDYYITANADGLLLESKRQQDSSDLQTLLSILADLSNALVWIVSALPVSNSPSPLTKDFGIVSSAPVIIGITINFLSHKLFSSLARSKYLSLFSFYLIFTLLSAGTAKSTIWQVIIIVYSFNVFHISVS